MADESLAIMTDKLELKVGLEILKEDMQSRPITFEQGGKEHYGILGDVTWQQEGETIKYVEIDITGIKEPSQKLGSDSRSIVLERDIKTGDILVKLDPNVGATNIVVHNKMHFEMPLS